MRTIPFISLATASLLLVTACDPGVPAASSSGPASAAATPAASASLTPVASPSLGPAPSMDPHPDVADLVISTEGILPLSIGLPIDTNPGADMIVFVPNYCYSLEMGITEGDLDRWIANYPDGTDVYGNPRSPFYLDGDSTEIYRIDVFDDDMPTTEGITIGATIDELQAAYPGLTEGMAGPVSRVYWVTGTNGYLVFETQDPDLGLGVPGATGPDAVILIRVIALDANPDFTAANSGNIAGACF